MGDMRTTDPPMQNCITVYLMCTFMCAEFDDNFSVFHIYIYIICLVNNADAIKT